RKGRSKTDTIVILGKIKRFDAKPVTRKHHTAAVPLPDCKSKHAQEPLDAARSPLGVSLENDFGVAVGKEAIPLFLQFAAQFAEIVDAPVKGDGEPELAVDHRLVRCGLGVQNAETPMSEAHTILREEPARIRPSAAKAFGHG